MIDKRKLETLHLKREFAIIFSLYLGKRLICDATSTINIVPLQNLCTSETNSELHQDNIFTVWSPRREAVH